LLHSTPQTKPLEQKNIFLVLHRLQNKQKSSQPLRCYKMRNNLISSSSKRGSALTEIIKFVREYQIKICKCFAHLKWKNNKNEIKFFRCSTYSPLIIRDSHSQRWFKLFCNFIIFFAQLKLFSVLKLLLIEKSPQNFWCL
jgi:hypothetical protein